jgi:TPR repeat protein
VVVGARERAGWLAFTALALLSAEIFPLPAQQGEASGQLLAEIKARAEKGDARDQLELGLAFDRGQLGVVTNSAEVVKWYRRSNQQDRANAGQGPAWLILVD